MKLNTLLFSSILITLTSCNGQTATQATNTDILNEGIAKGDTVKELGNNIMLVYQDKKNNYWFGSWETGLYRYDGKTILHFTTKSGLPHNRVEEIKEDKSGNIYVNTSKGIGKFDGQTFTTLSVTNSDNQWKLEPNDLWFRQGLDSGFVYRYDGNFLYKLQSPKHPKHSDSYAVYSIYKDSKGNVWFGTNPLGVYRYNGKSVDWISEEDVTELHNGPANGVRSIIEDKDGYFWFNTMYRYAIYGNNKNKQPFYTKKKNIGNLDGKKDSDYNEYLSIAKDNNNELWMATYADGIWHYNGKSIAHYPVKNGTKDITVFSIYKDNSGNLWLGTHENGAYKFNRQTFERFKP
ncbi:MAG: two-component regulator propeller domain-containing protein [Saprospiraceae bacterium]